MGSSTIVLAATFVEIDLGHQQYLERMAVIIDMLPKKDETSKTGELNVKLKHLVQK